KSTAVIQGKIHARSISIEAGAIINGSICIEEKIDDRDLVEKVKNRLPSRPPVSLEPAKITYMLFEDHEAEAKKAENAASQIKKPAPAVSKDDQGKPDDPGQGAAASSSNNWY